MKSAWKKIVFIKFSVNNHYQITHPTAKTPTKYRNNLQSFFNCFKNKCAFRKHLPRHEYIYIIHKMLKFTSQKCAETVQAEIKFRNYLTVLGALADTCCVTYISSYHWQIWNEVKIERMESKSIRMEGFRM